MEGDVDRVDASDVSGFYFFVPEGLRAPDQVWEIDLPGNQFELTGYTYSMGGGAGKKLVPRFDLVGWKLLRPAQRVTREGNIEKIDAEVKKYQEGPLCEDCSGSDFRAAQKYLDCQ